MRAPLSCLALALLFSALPTRAADDKDAKNKEPDLIPLGQLAGVVKSVGSGTLTLEVTQRHLELSPQAQANVAKDVQQLLARQQAILQTPNPAQRQQRMVEFLQSVQQLQRDQQNLFVVKETKSSVDLRLADDIKVRLPQPPVAFDEKGNFRQYTAKELKDLKGPDNLPGFTGEVDSLAAKQTVLVVAARKRPAKPADKDKEKDKDKEAEKSMAADEKPLATLIVILAEPMK
jgi:hypothetical protein